MRGMNSKRDRKSFMKSVNDPLPLVAAAIGIVALELLASHGSSLIRCRRIPAT